MRLARLGFVGALLFSALAFHGGTEAHAQCPIPAAVVVVPGATGAASGALGTPRQNPSSSQNIGCVLQVAPGLVSFVTSVTCFAWDGTNYGTCTSTDPQIIEAAKQLTLQSGLSFTWNSSAVCTQINVQTAACNP